MGSSVNRDVKSEPKFGHDTEIYRIMSFQRLADILVSKKNTLVHPSQWDDPFERWRLRNLPISNTGLKGEFFAQCWTLATHSNAMWKLYSNGTADGFRIRTTVGKLIKSLKTPYCIGVVEYLKKDELSCKTNICKICCASNLKDNQKKDFCEMAEKFMIKRLAFDYESEVRLVCFIADEEKKQINDEKKKFYRHKICPETLIDQIKIHPMVLEEYDYNALKEAIHKIGGINKNKIEWSRILDLI